MNILKKLGSLVPFKTKLKIQHQLGVPQMFWSIQNIKNNGFEPEFVVDAGAFMGDWTIDCRKIFPNAKILMIEGQETQKLHLSQYVNNNTFVEIGLIGSEKGKKVNFLIGGSNSNIQQGASTSIFNNETTTIDYLAHKNNFPRIDFIKLDIQGYELEALKGATDFIKDIEVILIEVSLIDIGNSGVPLIRDVINYMFENGFTTYDICSTRIRRPLDYALWQTDLIFVNNTSELLKSKMYS